MFITKRRKKQEEAGNTTINNSGVFINKSNVNINYKEQTPEATQGEYSTLNTNVMLAYDLYLLS